MSDKCPEHPEEKKLYCFLYVDRIADQRYNQAIEDAVSIVMAHATSFKGVQAFQYALNQVNDLKKPASREGE